MLILKTKNIGYFICLISILSSGRTVAQPTPNYDNLVWSDEFNGEGSIDTFKWFHQTLLPNGKSWYNGEVQHYTDRLENSYVKDGALHIKAKRESFTDQGVSKEFTSARLNSKYSFTYGKIEARVKLPIGYGTWPAIWMLGKNIQEPGGFFSSQYGTTPWPACGEIDIMEHWGTNQNYVSSAIHSPSSFGSTINVGGISANDVANNFHVFTCVWSPEKIEFSLNGTAYYTYEPQVQNDDTWPFFKPQYVLLNVALQAGTDPKFTESEMVVDYIRVYQEQPLKVVKDPGRLQVDVYPNPGEGNLLKVRLFKVIEAAQIIVYSMDGRLLLNEELKEKYSEIDVEKLNPGTYTVCIKSKDQIQTLKWVKW